MFADNHYKVAADFLRQRGIGTYGEAAGVSLEILEDTLLNKKQLDIPMGEFWMRDLHPWSMYYEDVRGAASASHRLRKDFGRYGIVYRRRLRITLFTEKDC
jgi:hypothetical protein